MSPAGQSALLAQSWNSPGGHDAWHVAEGWPPRPPNVKQHTSPFEQLAESVHESAAPRHCPTGVHDAVVPPRGGSGAQHTWVAALHVEAPQAMPPPLDPELPPDDTPLLEPDPPLLEPVLLPDVDADPLLLEPVIPLDDDADPLLLSRPPLEVDPDAPLDADTEPSSVVAPGINGPRSSPSGVRAPHPIASNTARVESGLIGFMALQRAPGAGRPQ
jgi:hypothetical protein